MYLIPEASQDLEQNTKFLYYRIYDNHDDESMRWHVQKNLIRKI